MAWAVLGEHAGQPLDRLGQSVAALPVARLGGKLPKQMSQAFRSDSEKLAVLVDPHDLLSDGERDDLRVGHASPGVLGLLGQEIVSGTEHRNQQQVEVGEHRGPLGSTARLGTADFDPAAPNPYPTAPKPWNQPSSRRCCGPALAPRG